MRALLIAGLLSVAAAAGAWAQDDACGQFSWSVGHEIDLFDEPLPVVKSGQSLPKEGVFKLQLSPVADVIYPVAPERGSDGGWGAVVTIESIPAGRYQIALSGAARLDAVQANKRLPVQAFERGLSCPGVRQSLQVEVKGEPLTLELGAAGERLISIALVRIWPFEWRW